MGVRVREKTKGSGVYWLFINHNGRRKAKRVGDKKAADLAKIKIQAALAEGKHAVLEAATGPVPRLKEFAEQWLDSYVAVHCKPATAENYRIALRKHWLPALGSLALDALTRDRIKTTVGRLLAGGFKASTVRTHVIPLQACLQAAVEAGWIPGNPAFRLGRFVRRSEGEEARPMDPFVQEEVTQILATAEAQTPEAYPVLLTMARTGLRVGEALTLQVDDLDFRARALWVRRTWSRGTVGTPKGGRARRVDMSQQLARVLQGWVTLREAEAVVSGCIRSPWLFPGRDGKPTSREAFYTRIWRPVLLRSGVRYRNPHQLRHAFASALIAGGESLAYVRDQLGHRSISLTVDVYGHLVPGANRRAVDALDDATGCNLYATSFSPSASEA